MKYVRRLLLIGISSSLPSGLCAQAINTRVIEWGPHHRVIVDDTGQWVINQGAGVKALEFMVNLLKSGVADPSSTSLSDRQVVDSFSAGEHAFRCAGQGSDARPFLVASGLGKARLGQGAVVSLRQAFRASVDQKPGRQRSRPQGGHPVSHAGAHRHPRFMQLIGPSGTP